MRSVTKLGREELIICFQFYQCHAFWIHKNCIAFMCCVLCCEVTEPAKRYRCLLDDLHRIHHSLLTSNLMLDAS